jgi:aflatoxin B1 aldehyde reductase
MTCKYNNWIRPTVYQGMYNCITRGIEAEVFAACRRYGLDLVVYNVIAGGLFSGKFKSKDWVPETGRFSNEYFTGPHYRHRYFRESNFRALQIIEPAAEKHNLTMIETALRWIVHHSRLNVKNGNDGIVIGISGVDQLESNLDYLEKGPLPDDVVQAVDEAWMVAKAAAASFVHGEVTYSYNVQKALFGDESSKPNGNS